jgi:uncharacterized membrane protein YbhN (UPF0104 family)
MAHSRSSRILQSALTVGLLCFAASRVNGSRLWEGAQGVSALTLAICLALGTAQVFVTSWRWHLMLNAVGVRQHPLRTFTINIASLLSNTLLVNVVAGAITRVYLLSKVSVPSQAALATTIIEKILTVATLVVMTGIGLWALDLPIVARLPEQFGSFAAVLIAVAVAGGLLVAWSPRTRAWRAQLGRYIARMWLVAREFGRNGAAVMAALGLTVLSQVLLLLVGGTASVALWPAAPLLSILLILPATMLLAGLPISVGGLGVREVSLIVMLGYLGVPAEAALLASLMILVSTLGGIVLAALLLLPFHLTRRATAEASP